MAPPSEMLPPSEPPSEPPSRPPETRADAERWVGRVIDERYQITRLIGVGGMGLVFEAEQLALRKPVALKLVQADFAGNGEVATRFAREAMATARIDHPHVASAIDYGQLADGTTYLVMQLVRGENLAERMCRQRIPWPEACEIAAQIADALAAAHREGIVHRDLKPDNVMLSPRDDGMPHVRVLDFGIARVPAEPSAAPVGAAPDRPLTKIGTVVGTPGYMAPEQALDEPVGPKSDLYTLGILLWEMITGKELYPENDLTRIVTRQLSQPSPRLVEASDDPSVPASLQERVDELLAGVPDARPRDAAVVRDALRSVVARASLSGARPFPLPPSPTPGHGSAVCSDDVPTQRLAGAVGVPPTATAPAIPSALGAPDGASRSSRPPAQHARPSLLRRLAPALGLLLAALSLAAFWLPARAVLERGMHAAWPEEIEEEIRVMLGSDGYERRKRAAERLLAHRPAADVPAFARAVAELELATGCAERVRAIDAVDAAGEPRALPAIRRLQHQPETGCGPDGREDCYGCIRAELLRTARHLRELRDSAELARGGAPAGPPSTPSASP